MVEEPTLRPHPNEAELDAMAGVADALLPIEQNRKMVNRVLRWARERFLEDDSTDQFRPRKGNR